MKKISLTIVLALLLSLALAACGGSTPEEEYIPVPNVMGIDYNAAQGVLEDADFTVTAVEADASTILQTSLYDRSVMKGQVFKVNDELDPNYNDYSTITKTNKVVIYYAVEDYTVKRHNKSAITDRLNMSGHNYKTPD
jgi:beta-lactam-binding protein with PASTA domain